MGLFGGDSSTTVSTTNQQISDSNNQTLSSNRVIENAGNLNLTLPTPGQWEKFLPYFAIACFLIGVVLLVRGNTNRNPFT